MNRRNDLGGMGVLGPASLASRLVIVSGRAADRRPPSIAAPRFQLPLKIPPVLEPAARTETQDEYDIVQREAELEILPGHITRIWGYQGCFPGPTIRVRRHRTAVVRHTNQLATHTVVHLHGGITPADSDGFPMD